MLLSNHTKRMWETSIMKIIAVFDEQFSGTNITSHLLIKDYVTLFNATHRQNGYEVSALLKAFAKIVTEIMSFF